MYAREKQENQNPLRPHFHNTLQTCTLIGTSTILQRYFNDISKIAIVKISLKYR